MCLNITTEYSFNLTGVLYNQCLTAQTPPRRVAKSRECFARFKALNLTSVIIPNSVTSIGDFTFDS